MGLHIPESSGPVQEPKLPELKKQKTLRFDKLDPSDIKKDIKSGEAIKPIKQLSPNASSTGRGEVLKESTKKMAEKTKKSDVALFSTIKNKLIKSKPPVEVTTPIISNNGKGAMKLISEIESNHLTVPGLFREEGTSTVITELREKIVKKGDKATFENLNVKDLTSALKRTFRDYKEGLISSKAEFMRAGDESLSVEEQIGLLKACIKQLSPENREVLKAFCELAFKISQNSGVNKMDLPNIAIASSASLYEQGTTMEEIMSEGPKARRAFQVLVENRKTIF